MEMKVLSERDNLLLKRKEVHVEIRGETTPMRVDVKRRIAAEYGADENLVIVDRMDTVGPSRVRAYVKIYEDKEIMDTIEPEYKIKRNTTKEVSENGEGTTEQEVGKVSGE